MDGRSGKRVPTSIKNNTDRLFEPGIPPGCIGAGIKCVRRYRLVRDRGSRSILVECAAQHRTALWCGRKDSFFSNQPGASVAIAEVFSKICRNKMIDLGAGSVRGRYFHGTRACRISPLCLVVACTIRADPTRVHSTIALHIRLRGKSDCSHLRILISLISTRGIDHLCQLAMNIIGELVAQACR